MLSIPLTFERDPDDAASGGWLVEGSVGGVPRTFLLDTGAGLSQLTSDEQTIHFEVGLSSPTTGVFGVAAIDHTVIARDVRLGELHLPLLSMTRVEPIEGHRRDLIGMDILRTHRITLLTASLRLELEETSATAGGLLTVDASGHAFVEVEISGDTAYANVDTGASISLVDQRFLATHPAAFTELGLEWGTDVTGSRASTMTYLLAGMVIAGVTFAPRKVVAIDLSAINAKLPRAMDLILGYPTLSQADWGCDFPAGRFAVTAH